MATLQQHKEAMVDLLANGSAIPASASRLAHALHDVLALLEERRSEPHRAPVEYMDFPTIEGHVTKVKVPRDSRVSEHMGTFIQDVRLAADLDACPEPRNGLALIDNLRAELANVTNQRNTYKARCESLEAEIEARCAQYEEVAAENKELKGYLSRGFAGVVAYQEDKKCERT